MSHLQHNITDEITSTSFAVLTLRGFSPTREEIAIVKEFFEDSPGIRFPNHENFLKFITAIGNARYPTTYLQFIEYFEKAGMSDKADYLRECFNLSNTEIYAGLSDAINMLIDCKTLLAKKEPINDVIDTVMHRLDALKE